MRVLDRYIMLALGRYIALTMIALAVLLAVFLFINEQGWVGAGSYGQRSALTYVLLQLPSAALAFVPVAVLLGALLAIGQLARGSEITVMRAAGISIARIAASIAMAGLLLVPAVAVVGEWLAPPLAQHAHAMRTLERGDDPGAAQGASWLRDEQRLLHADGQGGLTVFELDDTGALASITRAARADLDAPGSWQLHDSVQTRFDADGVSEERTASRTLQTTADAEFLRIAGHDPRQQSMTQLIADIRVLDARQQDSRRQHFALWSAVARLVAIPLAMLLALPLLLGFLRHSEAGARASAGLVLGLAYFIAQRLVENGAVVFAVPAPLLAWAPTLLLGAAVAVLLWQARGISAA